MVMVITPSIYEATTNSCRRYRANNELGPRQRHGYKQRYMSNI